MVRTDAPGPDGHLTTLAQLGRIMDGHYRQLQALQKASAKIRPALFFDVRHRGKSLRRMLRIRGFNPVAPIHEVTCSQKGRYATPLRRSSAALRDLKR